MDRVPQSIRERRVFVDTSAFLAVIDANDRYHKQANQIKQRLARDRFSLITTRYAVVETHAGLLRAVGSDTAREFLQVGLSGINIERVRRDDEEQADKIVFQFRDKDYSLCDATSFAVMRRLALTLAFAFDDHFRQHGFSTPLDRRDWP